jgi:hypothetical protein
MHARLVAAALASATLAACGGTGGGGAPIPTPGASATLTVGPEGGSVPLGADGPVLRIPPNALTGSVTITIQDTGTRSPEGAPIYEFRPEGTRVSKPIEIEMPVPSGTTSPAIY